MKYSKTYQETGRKKNSEFDTSFLPEKTRWLFHENSIVCHSLMPIKKQVQARVYTGIEALRYLGPTRKYVTQRFKITESELDVFLYLYPYNYFTKTDYDRIAKPFLQSPYIRTLVKQGHVVPVFFRKDLSKGNVKKSQAEDIYTLSLSAKRAVNYFYNVLCKEKKPYHFKTVSYSKSETKNKLVKDLLREMQDPK